MGPMIRWEPMATMSRLRHEMNRLLEDFFGETAEERAPGEFVRVPVADVVDRENDILVRAELPGIDKDSLQVQATPDTLMILGTVKKEAEEREKDFYRRERRIGVFQRTIPLPVEVDANGVKAAYHDGVLEVTLPKTEKAKTTQPVHVPIE